MGGRAQVERGGNSKANRRDTPGEMRLLSCLDRKVLVKLVLKTDCITDQLLG